MGVEKLSGSVAAAGRIRCHVLRMIHRARATHVASCLSAADILAVLYWHVLRVDAEAPRAPDRDRFVLSKGHAAALLYATLAERGFISEDQLSTYCQNGTLLAGHATTEVPGVEFSTGSLGHGLGVAAGIALASGHGQRPFRVFALLSDGECDEGSVWEAAMFAGQHQLGSLVAIIDYNKMQAFGWVREVMDLEPFSPKWQSFGWEVREVNGHDHSLLREILETPRNPQGKPLVVIAHTIKGKGVSFMENQLSWHYRCPSPVELAQALQELEG